ncbi:unnamed protein product [Microthlaspi erraticum]|uniref:F-box domain-containing protein n=1 Tax=Microthlaspi erraticum TaxID=1685480 RepID=A0A6D2HI60_9BRAS|nr:unnamed protein product [Microthlaspi erraticum]
MDKISELPDALLVKILSFVPTKVAVSTSILSKRWDFVWMLLPRLEFSDRYSSLAKSERLQCFLDRNLPLHRAMVIESFCLKLGKHSVGSSSNLWVQVATSRHLRELEICVHSWENKYILSSSVYTCKSLLILKLSGDILMDVPRMACLPSLKSLQLYDMRRVDDKSFQRLLSSCPVLEDLLVSTPYYDYRRDFTIIVPSLKRLSLYIPSECHLNGYVIDTPSLKDFKVICDHIDEVYIGDAHEILDLNSIFVSVTSVKRLEICSKVLYGNDFTLNQLKHLKLCVCREYSSDFLVQFLKDSPKLRELDLFMMDGHEYDRIHMDFWNQLSIVPECLISSLQIFNWSQYFGSPEERDIAVYILQYARRLETAKILDDSCDVPNLEMLKELTLSTRASTTCQLEFIED